MYPKFVTHYHLSDKKPFLNLSDLGGKELTKVIKELESRQKECDDFNRVYGGRYMELRKKTEDKLRKLFINAGGSPQRKSPHYFVLGESFWFKHLCPDTAEVKIPLSYFSSSSVSITYPDSLVSMGYMPDFELLVEKKPYHNRVFKLEDLDWLIGKFGLPRDDYRKEYKNYTHEEFEKFIEVQVWDDSPLDWG
ncbi:MAG: hypothetical protein AAGI45_23180 [Cyanobacteria bacterium P01_H01_bin.26]